MLFLLTLLLLIVTLVLTLTPPASNIMTRTRSSSTPNSASAPVTGGGDGDAPAQCGRCAKHVGDHDQSIECDLCNRWYHVECTDLTKTDLKTVAKPSIKWYCFTCNDTLSSLDSRIKTLEKVVNDQVAKQTTQIQHSTVTWADLASKLDSNNTFIESQVKTLKAELNKDKEKDFRSKNVILFGIKEDENTTFDQTIDQIQSVLSDCHLPPIELPKQNVHRLGPRTPSKNRPIRIKLSSDTQKWEYLRRINQNRSKGIFARLDLNKEEQERDFRLREELKQRKSADPGGQYKIAKGEIVKIRQPTK